MRLLLLLFFLTPFLVQAQNSVAIDTQAYPAGIIPGIRFDYALGNNSYLTSRIGYNFADRKDYGKNNNEKGDGLGFSIGYARTNFLAKNLTAHLGTDLWFMDIDWKNTQRICGIVPPCGDVTSTGTTEIIVLQPTFGVEYNIPFSKNLFLKPSFSFGYEININTKGREVGEGAIVLGGLSFGYQF